MQWTTDRGRGASHWGGALSGVPSANAAWTYAGDAKAAMFGKVLLTQGKVILLDDQPGLSALDVRTGDRLWQFQQPNAALHISLIAAENVLLCDRWVVRMEDGELLHSLEELSEGVALSSSIPALAGNVIYRPVNGREAGGRYFRIDGRSGDVDLVDLPFVFIGARMDTEFVIGFEGAPPDTRLVGYDVAEKKKVWTSEPVDRGAPIIVSEKFVGVGGQAQFSLLTADGELVFAKSYNDFAADLTNKYDSKPLIAMSDEVVYLSRGAELVCFDLHGMQQRWHRQLDHDIRSISCAGGFVFVALRRRNALALSAQTGAQVWSFSTSNTVDTIQASGGHAVAVMYLGDVIAFECGT